MFCISPRMPSLKGIELIDCVKANAEYGLIFTAKQCGFAYDIKSFQEAFEATCKQMNISFQDFDDCFVEEFIEYPEYSADIEFSPKSPSMI